MVWWNARDLHPALLLARQVCRSQHLQPTLSGNLVRVERVELSPRVPKTRMLALHHTRRGNDEGGTMNDELFFIPRSSFIIFFSGSGETRTLTTRIKSAVLSRLSF